MKTVYIYTALTTVGGADRVITEKANCFADNLEYNVYIITDSQDQNSPVFPLSSKIHIINLNIMFEQQYNHTFLMRRYYYFKIMRVYKRKLSDLLCLIKNDFTISVLKRVSDFINDLPDENLKIGEAHVSKHFMRNFYLLD